jgi:serine/threonine protein kinase
MTRPQEAGQQFTAVFAGYRPVKRRRTSGSRRVAVEVGSAGGTLQLTAGAEIDRYVVEGLLGRGGMAVVYRARHRQLGSLHALKLLQGNAVSPERLILEGRAQSALRHPNVVAVTDVVEVRGAPALVLDFVDGPPLDAFLARVRPTLAQADHLAEGILRGVAAAHRLGLVHRDLKPGNVLLAAQDGQIVPKVTDFGLARLLDDGSSPVRTRTGATMGTPAYMAPEQVRDAHGVDARADVFALGAILYELVCGRRAFDGADSLEVMNAVAEARFRHPREIVPDLPDRMERAIVRALARDRDQRIASVDALLATWRGGESLPPADWDPALLERKDPIVSVEPASTAGTWSGSLAVAAGASPVAAGYQPAAAEDLQRASSPVPRRWARSAALFAAGTVAGVPFLLGDFGLLFGDVFEAMRAGGFFVPVLIAFAAVAVGGLVVVAADERDGREPVLAWLLLPGAVTALGSLGTLMGARVTNAYVAGVDASDQAFVAALGTSESLVSQLGGTTVGASLFTLAAVALAWSRQKDVARTGLPQRAWGPIAVALAGGTALWLAHPWLSGQPGLGWNAPYVVFVTLAVCAAAVVSTIGDEPSDKLVRPQLILAFTCALAAAHAARAVDARYVMHASRAFAAGEVVPGDVSAAEQLVASVHLSSAPSLAWGVLGFVVGALPLIGVLRPGHLPVRALVCGLLTLAVLSPVKLAADAEVGSLATGILPGSVRAASRWHLGVELTDEAGAVRVSWAPEGSAVQASDRVVAVEDRAFEDAGAIVHALWDCRCDGGSSCPVAASCLARGAPVRLTVLRAADDGPPVKLDVTLPLRPVDP